jgi:hypothetical protein
LVWDGIAAIETKKSSLKKKSKAKIDVAPRATNPTFGG